MHRWTQAEWDYLAETAPGRSRKEIIDLFHARFGDEVSGENIIAAMKRREICNGIDARFQKGQVSHNKGQKMTEELYRKAQPTMFKKGELPHNTLPVGAEVITDDGYIKVKVSDRRDIPARFNWKLKHRLVWEEAHGPIPEGHVIVFLDRNRQNVDIDNLACVSRKIYKIVNQKGFASTDPEITKMGIRLAELISKRAERQKGEK